KYYLYTVGYDEETKSIDIDRIATGISASERQKIILVRETINKLEGRLGKLIPITEIFKELEGKIEIEKIEKIIEKLNRSGEIFMPRKGHLQKVG
ncbi:Minichromosome maintenance protein MCM, partial [Candidatus Pacearchaeota archaeon CG_4_9_14_3_um_filter_31_7]